MVRVCVVESCRAEWMPNSNVSFFAIKKDKATLDKWREVIPRLREVKNHYSICSKHFAPECINEVSGRKFLKKDAVPTIFDKKTISTANTSEVSSSRLRQALIGHKSIPLAVYLNNVQLQRKSKLDVRVESNYRLSEKEISPEKRMHSVQVQTHLCGSSLVKRETEMRKKIKTLQTRVRRQDKRIQTTVELVKSLRQKDTTGVASQAPDVGMDIVSSPIKVSSCNSPVADSLINHRSSKVPSSLEINEQNLEETASTSAEYSAYIPESWSFSQIRNEDVQLIVFSYAITKLEKGQHCPVTQKCVTLDVDGTIKYFVYGRYIDPQDIKLERVLKKKEMLSNVLKKFKRMNVCNGLGDVSVRFAPTGEVYQDYLGKWRSKSCSLLSKKKRCVSCVTSRKCLLRRASRLKIGVMSKRIDRSKLLAIRMKIRRENRLKLKDRMKYLNNATRRLGGAQYY